MQTNVATYTTIAQTLKREILRGDWACSQQLPPQGALRQRFGVSAQTMQRAMNDLQRENLVITRSTAGSFVAEHPPHLFDIALLLPADQMDSLFFSALSLAADELTASGPYRLRVSHPLFSGTEAEYLENDLAVDLEQGRLAGVICAVPDLPDMVKHAVAAHDHLFAVSIGARPEIGLPCVSPDIRSFARRSAAYLLESGRRRVAWLGRTSSEEWFHELSGILAECGLHTPSHWIQMPSMQNDRSIRQLAHLLLAGPDRPDALVIDDDHLLTASVAGVCDAGLPVPDTVELVAFCNFPRVVPQTLPVTRLGYRCQQLLQTAIDIVGAQRAGEPLPSVTWLEARFEHEISP